MSKFLKASFLAFGAVGVLGAGSLLHPQEVFAQASSTVGGVRGAIKDKANGEAAIGATVVATSPALVGEQVVITDENGLYFIPSIPPGVYTLTIYYNNQPFSRGNVLVQVGKEAVVNVTVDSAASAGKPAGEVIEIKGTVPIVDQGSTKTGMTITEDYTRNIPTGRSFGAVVGSSAGSQDDFYGVSLAGATSAENVYVVEGINTTDTGFGGISSNLPNEFVAETEVITGGYNAEFGRATGGIVNVVTKSGSNEFKGSVFGYFRPGSLVADAEVIQREGAAIDSKTDLDYAYDVGGEIGGPIIKDKLWFHVGFNPSSVASTRTRIVQSLVDANNDGIPDVDQETGFTVREEVNSTEHQNKLTTYFFTAKINGAISANHQFQVSAFGNPRTGDLGVSSAALNRNPSNTFFATEDGAYDLSAKWTSKFNEGKTQVDAVVGFHRGFENQTPANASQDVPYVVNNSTFSRPLYDFAALEGNIEACNDGSASDKYMMIDNCPTAGYATQGLGFLEERQNNRTSGVLAVTQRVKAGGYHTFKAGLDVELATYDSKRGITGGAQFRRNQLGSDAAPASYQLRELMSIVRPLGADEDPMSVTLGPNQLLCASDRAICETTEKATAETDNLGFAAFVQDSWQVLPNLTLNAGIRWEQQTGYVGEALRGNLTPEGFTIPDEAYKINDMFAPRIGVIFDPTKEGKAKIFGHWGRFYESIPMDINVRAFGGEISNFQTINNMRLAEGAPGYDPNCDVDFDPGDPNRDLGAILRQCEQRGASTALGGGTEFVAPGMKGQYTQELILGAEYELVADFKVGLNYIHRTLPTVIEDMSTDGGNHYIIGNPGSDYNAEADEVRRLGEQALAASGCMDLNSEPGVDGCDGQLQAQAATHLRRAGEMAFIDNFDKPARNYDAVQLTITQRPTGRSLIQASYTYSVSKGNYPGLFSTDTNQLDPNLTSLYDLPDLMANRYGNMGLDRPHNLKVDGFYQFDLKKAGLITVGASGRAQSGIAHNALASHVVYGSSEAFLLPRGSFERSPVTTTFDAHFSYGRRLNKTTTVELFARFFNLLDTQDELDVDETYTFDSANPIVGGRIEDLKHLKPLDPDLALEQNRSVVLNKNFGRLNARQAPRSVQLGARLTF